MLERQPESNAVMDVGNSVSAFDEAGSAGGPLAPIYLFNATQLSRLLPEGAKVLELGCGSAQFIRYLLSGRPDLSAIGMDLSEPMLKLAEERLVRSGFSSRVDLVLGDWREADSRVNVTVDAVISISALHHCPGKSDLVMVLDSIRRIRESHRSAVWLFDLVRPESRSSLDMIPRMYEMSTGAALDPVFRTDWVDSLAAGWTFDEFRACLEIARLDLSSSEANYSQLHWAYADGRPETSAPEWSFDGISERDLARAAKMQRAFKDQAVSQ